MKTKRAMANCSNHVSYGSSRQQGTGGVYQGSSKVDASGTGGGAVHPLRLAEGQAEDTFARHGGR